MEYVPDLPSRLVYCHSTVHDNLWGFVNMDKVTRRHTVSLCGIEPDQTRQTRPNRQRGSQKPVSGNVYQHSPEATELTITLLSLA